MFDNQALEITIGLFFIYALYSLFTTTVSEIIATAFNLRGKILKNGIKRMLDNDEPQDNSLESPSEIYFPENLSSSFFSKASFKYLGRKSLWGKYKDPSYLNSKTFAHTLLTTLGVVNTNKADLNSLSDKLNDKNETHQFIKDLLEQSDYKIVEFRILLEEWYHETMNRVAGWYKRRISRITFGISFLIAFGFNINTIDIANILGENTKTKSEMLSVAINYINTQNNGDNKQFSNDLREIQKKVHSLVDKSTETKSILKIKHPWSKDEQNRSTLWSYIFGCLISTFALSIGAPFWFDLLNKLVKLRSAGIQENEKGVKS